jgi:heavy metal translocating P-type ATPase
MSITYPEPGRVVVANVPFLRELESDEFRTFMAVLLDLAVIEAIAIFTRRGRAEVRFDATVEPEEFGEQLEALLRVDRDVAALPVPLKADAKGVVRVYRHDGALSSWNVVSDIPGRLRVRSERLFRRKKLCHDIERELMTVVGVERFRTSSMACSILVHYDPKAITTADMLTTLDEIVQSAEDHPHLDENKYELLLSSAAVVLAAAAQWIAPVLYLPAATLFLYCVIPTFKGARDTLFKERRLGVDVLDAIVVIMCLISYQVFAGAVLAWCLAFGRRLLDRAQEDSRRRLINVFAKQARTAYLYVDGVEVNVPLDRVNAGDLVAVHTGEMIPVDGVVFDGVAVVDQHALTGESVPVEKEAGSRVYASTIIIGGRILVSVEKTGKETTSARITTILNDTAMFRLASQSRGEMLADKAVIPTLALASLGYASVGLHGATAIVNCDFGTGIRMAAPLALLSSLSVCASRGILIKDGRALEEISNIDTILFDKTGTLTKEKPAVDHIHTFGNLSEDEVLTFAAAAERRLSHPIADAIVGEFLTREKIFPATDHSSYSIGYGIGVTVEEHAVRVGSRRYMTQENIAFPQAAEMAEAKAHDDGHMIVYVGVDGELAGAIELAPQLREGIAELIVQLREAGVSQVVIISGDHEKPTGRLANALGVDRYFAEVLPEDKARYVEMLQKEGRRVCFVGDGINDAIALRRANVSISIRGATTVATDTAQVVLMDENLGKLGEFIDIARELDCNVATSWKLILVPNLACIAGAFFLGFGVMTSVLANNVAAIAALANGLRPLRMYPDEKKRQRLLAPMALQPAKKRQRLGDLIPPGPPTRKSAALLIGVGLLGFVMPGLPGWPFFLLGAGMLIPRHRRPALLERWLQKSIPGRLHRAVRSMINHMNAWTRETQLPAAPLSDEGTA